MDLPLIELYDENHRTLDTDDLKLIEGCKAGKREAQKALYFKYRNKLLGLCRRYAQNNQEAEDILQEGFIKIFKDLYQFKPFGSFPAWLHKVMVNAALKYIRDNKWDYEVLDQQHTRTWAYPEVSPDQLPDRETLIHMIQQLPAGYRSVFNLYAIEGYSHEEISQILQISTGTSRSQYFKAKKMLRNLFEKIVLEEK